MIKKLIYAIWGLLLMSPGMLPAQQMETTVTVKPDVPPENEVIRCEKAVVSGGLTKEEDKDRVTVQLYCDSFSAIKANVRSLKAAFGPNLIKFANQTATAKGGVWAIVVDDSDPKGRRAVIPREIMLAAGINQLISDQSRVALYSLALKLEMRASSAKWNRSGDDSKVLIPSGRTGGDGFSQFISVCFNDWNWNAKGSPAFSGHGGASKLNTNLWAGLYSLIDQHLLKQKSGEYADAPLNIVLLSDGVDEGKSGNLQSLIQLAQKHDVRIHTIAYPFKSSSSHRVDASLQKGYSDLYELSGKTGGKHYSVDAVSYRLEEAETKLTTMIHENELAEFVFQFNFNEMYAAFENDGTPDALAVYFCNENNDAVGSAIISAKDMTRFYVNSRLKWIQKMTEYYRAMLVTKAKEGTLDKDLLAEKLKELGSVMMTVINVSGMQHDMNVVEVNGKFKTLLSDLTKFFEQNPGVAHSAEAPLLVGKFLIGIIQLEDLRQSTVSNNEPNSPVVVNSGVSVPTEVDEDTERSIVLDWVWWILGLCGSVVCVLIFYCIYRSMSKPKGKAQRVIVKSVSVPSAPTPAGERVLASLTNTSNNGQSWKVLKSSCSVGRRASNDISLPYTHVSGTQFILTRDSAGQWELRDTNSTNGTMVNGIRVSAATRLRNGDKISIGPLEMEFVSH